MKQNTLRQLVTVFSVIVLILIPVAIFGVQNIGDLRNFAGSKRFVQDANLTATSIESSTITSINDPLTLTINVTQSGKLSYLSSVIEFDPARISLSDVSIVDQESTGLKIVKSDSKYLIVPVGNQVNALTDLDPTTCIDTKACDTTSLKTGNVKIKLSGQLLKEVTSQQRPVKVTVWSASETGSSIIWNKKEILPEIKFGASVKNASPEFVSEPLEFAEVGTKYEYTVETKDADKDTVKLSLSCPDYYFCETTNNQPQGVKLDGSKLVWESPVKTKSAPVVTIYANDGKSIVSQIFVIKVLDKGENSFSCTFTPGLAVKVLDYRTITPLILNASLSSGISKVQVELVRQGTIEKTFTYNFDTNPRTILLDENSQPTLAYQFQQGTYTGEAFITDKNGKLYKCELTNVFGLNNSKQKAIAGNSFELIKSVEAAANAITVGTNNAPTFATDPKINSTPGTSIKVGNTYTYKLKATDVDGDPLSYKTVTMPSWASASVLQNVAGTVELQITGVPTTGGTNLFSFSVNDGAGHYITQTWIVNVDFANNDIPVINLTAPSTVISRAQGQSFQMQWDVQDRNQVVKFDLYYTTDLSKDPILLISNIDYRVRSLSVSTAKVAPGDYYFVLKATDNVAPPAVGEAFTPLVHVGAPLTSTPTPTPSTTVTATPSVTVTTTATVQPTITVTITETPIPSPSTKQQLEVTFTSPKEGDKISADTFKILGRVQATDGAKVTSKQLTLLLDDQDITSKLTFSAEEGTALTFTYSPKVLLTVSNHTLTAKAEDSSGAKLEQKINFGITALTLSQTDTQVTEILGFKIPSSLTTVVLIGIVILVVALLLPIFLYFAWRGERTKQQPPKQVIPPPTLQRPVTTNQFAPQNQVMPQVAPVQRSYLPSAPGFGNAQPRPMQPSYSPEKVGFQQQPQKPPMPTSAPMQQPVQRPAPQQGYTAPTQPMVRPSAPISAPAAPQMQRPPAPMQSQPMPAQQQNPVSQPVQSTAPVAKPPEQSPVSRPENLPSFMKQPPQRPPEIPTVEAVNKPVSTTAPVQAPQPPAPVQPAQKAGPSFNAPRPVPNGAPPVSHSLPTTATAMSPKQPPAPPATKPGMDAKPLDPGAPIKL